MLIGSYEVKLTDKRRLAIPKKFRSEIGDKYVLAKWYEGCLVLISQEKFGSLISKIGGDLNLVAPVRETARFVMGSAFEESADNQGRVIIPQNLVNYAQFEKEVVCVGLGDRVELWSKKIWIEKEKMLEEKSASYVETINNNG